MAAIMPAAVPSTMRFKEIPVDAINAMDCMPPLEPTAAQNKSIHDFVRALSPMQCNRSLHAAWIDDANELQASCVPNRIMPALYTCAVLRPWDPRPPVKGEMRTEQWPLCRDRPLGDDCLVYSFGIANDFHFDDMMAQHGCEVHSFDPTRASFAKHTAHRFRPKLGSAGSVKFHPWGLGSELPSACRYPQRRDGGSSYGIFLPDAPLLNLNSIRRRLGHEHRR